MKQICKTEILKDQDKELLQFSLHILQTVHCMPFFRNCWFKEPLYSSLSILSLTHIIIRLEAALGSNLYGQIDWEGVCEI